MEYTINKVAKLSGISTRTLRYYDEINLLKPARISSSNYRIYEQKQIDRLQQILFYKHLGFELEKIKVILNNDDYSNIDALISHRQKLLIERNNIDQLLNTIDKTIKYYRGEQNMTNEEKFAAFKNEQIEKNMEKYGEELVEKYSKEAIEKANKKYLSLSKDDMSQMKKVEGELFKSLNELNDSKDVKTSLGKKVFELHKKWLSFTWTDYSAQAHKGLVDMYLADQRFADYYIKNSNENAPTLLHDAVYYYA
ncbi:MerR family transcriptional regulator [Companilactobacillus sp. DQM5]|uniref:MerR family transcriptional regulator n=1 Tax=Companilactobacillus sp. DQM5 TaxID=3463359 RepID=UPI00405918DD